MITKVFSINILKILKDYNIRFKYQSKYDFYNNTDLIMVPPHGEAIIDVRTIDKKRKFEMQFEVLNALTAPATHPVFRILVRPKQ